MINSRLREIIRGKREEIDELRRKGIHYTMVSSERRDFKKAISRPGRINIIAEIKFASPSAGIIRDDLDPVHVARIYEEEGIAAISLLTEKRFFKGDISWLPQLKKAISIPILRKDFIIDPIQVKEAKAYGADAVLLIVRILTEKSLKELFSISKDLGMDVLVEVHNEGEIKKAIDVGADIIGINNRDLTTFHVDKNTTFRLLKYIPDDCTIVSESGISGGKDVSLLKAHGINAVLVGTTIMKSRDIRKKVRELVNAGKYDQV